MRKLIFINDLHLSSDNPVGRLDDVWETGLKKLDFVLDWAHHENAGILVAGDFFHKPRSWVVLPELIDTITREDNIFAIYGQHDTYMYSEETRDSTTLGVLAKAGKVSILNGKPRKLDDNIRIYGCHYGQEIPDPGTDNYFNILVIHAPIAEKAVWVTQDYMDAGKFLKDHPGFDIIHCGDIHQKFCIEQTGRYIVNSGPMIRREATVYNYEHKPGFWVWDIRTQRMSWVEIPHKSAELVLSREHIELKEEANEILKDFIQSVKTEMVDDASIIANIWSIIKENGIGEEIIDVIAKTIGQGRFHGKE